LDCGGTGHRDRSNAVWWYHMVWIRRTTSFSLDVGHRPLYLKLLRDGTM
jgi:hypothetical protein